jgi:site-specific DNA recombinase
VTVDVVRSTPKRNGRRRAAERPEVTRCAAYVRQSVTEDHDKAFTSLDAQLEAIEAYVQSQRHEGWVLLPDRYADPGLSGGTMERPGLRRLLDDVGAGKIDAIVTYRLDRLSRSLLDFSQILARLKAHDVSCVSVSEAFDTGTPTGRLHMNMLMTFAEYERELIKQRTSDKMRAARRRGKWTGGIAVLGYDVAPEGGRLVINAAEAERLRSIFGLYADLQSLSATVRNLRNRGWRMKSWTTRRGELHGGAAFTKSSLSALLRNPLLIGKVRCGDEIVDGEHEAIVPADLWERVQARLRANDAGGGAASKNKHGALLTGLIWCGACGCRMTHTYTKKGNKLFRYYVCLRASKEGWHVCPTRSLPAGEVERFVVDRIRGIGRDPALVAETLGQARAQLQERVREKENDRRLLERELRQHQDDITRVLAGRNGRRRPRQLAEAEERVQAVEERLREVTAEIEALKSRQIDEADLTAALAKFDPVWDALTPREQARAIELLVERVSYDGRTEEIEITFRPTGIRALAEENDPVEDIEA